MSNPTLTPPIPPEERLALEQRARYNRIVRNLAIGGAIACPIIILLPPRKLDLYTFSLSVGFYLSADHLVTLRTGRGLVQQFAPKTDAMPTDKAREMQRVIREEREKGRIGGEEGEKGLFGRIWMGGEKEGWKERRLEEERRALEEGKGYWDMIGEQIWEVWNWDNKKSGDGDGGKKE